MPACSPVSRHSSLLGAVVPLELGRPGWISSLPSQIRYSHRIIQATGWSVEAHFSSVVQLDCRGRSHETLHVDPFSSSFGQQLSQAIVAAGAAQPGFEVERRSCSPTDRTLNRPSSRGGWLAPRDVSTGEDRRRRRCPRRLPPTVVVGAPMYNFSIPSQLRPGAVLPAGRTFRYTERPVGPPVTNAIAAWRALRA